MYYKDYWNYMKKWNIGSGANSNFWTYTIFKKLKHMYTTIFFQNFRGHGPLTSSMLLLFNKNMRSHQLSLQEPIMVPQYLSQTKINKNFTDSMDVKKCSEFIFQIFYVRTNIG